MQGVVKAFDPASGEGVVVSDADRSEHVLAPGALEGSVFRMLRQGQRVVFDLDDAGRAGSLRTGAEPDMGLPTAIV
ncbi:MAG: cold shock domain-containing protein [Acidimicrobiia bacterium]|nr:cold shock domain-containing protein [Acidimicrobiia bacterium]